MGGRQTPNTQASAVIVAVAVIVLIVLMLVWPAKAKESTPRVISSFHGKTIRQWYQQTLKRKAQRDDLQRRLTGRVLQVRALNKAVRLHFERDVMYGIKLAAATFPNVSISELHAVASCESGHSATAQNGRYRGVFQEGPMFEGGPYGHAGFSVWDPVANAMMAAYTVSREGWSQWTCRP